MKRIIAAILLSINFLAVSGCGTRVFHYEIRQDRNRIEKVEICSFDYYNNCTIEPLVSLSENEIDMFLSDISSMECYDTPFVIDPILDYGDIIACITYSDGEVEVIGPYNIGYIAPNGELATTTYNFDKLEIRSLFLKFIDADIILKASCEPEWWLGLPPYNFGDSNP